ncbi:transketolase family protein [Candidatus Riflebacteria bacterium]
MAKKATRASFGEALIRAGEKYPQVVVMDADLSKSTKSDGFANKFPQRFFEMGISEANMIGTAAGMALSGKIPFICSFACFLIGRYDIIRMSVAYCDANVKLVGTHCGVGIGEDGYSQQGLEDLALMRALPNMAVVQPGDHIQTLEAVEYAVNHKGPVYLRLTRQAVEDLPHPGRAFEFGKGEILREGDDGTIIATGGTVYYSLAAAEQLNKEGKGNFRVVNISTIDPIDSELIENCSTSTRQVLTVEDHVINGGLGGAVAEVLSENAPCRLKRHGVLNVFGESGTPEQCYKKFKLDKEGIIEVAADFFK